MDVLISGKKQYTEDEYNNLSDQEKQNIKIVTQYKSFNYIWIDGYDSDYPMQKVYREINKTT